MVPSQLVWRGELDIQAVPRVHEAWPAQDAEPTRQMDREVIWPWFLHVTGTDNTSGYWYGWWSGFGGFTFMGLTATWLHLRRHNCHAKGCWRIGKHPVDGTPYVTCRKHHPTHNKRVTAQEIAQHQRDAEVQR
jgi:hypothetical protein